jgi:hypothetical protein
MFALNAPGSFAVVGDAIVRSSISSGKSARSGWCSCADSVVCCPMRGRVQGHSISILVTIALTAAAGLLRAPWWLTLFGFAALTLLSLQEHRRLRPRFAAVGALDVLDRGAWTSAGHCLLAAATAYGWGQLVRLIFFG